MEEKSPSTSNSTSKSKSALQLLIVDCDNTLIEGDLLHEQIIRLLKSNPLRLFALIWRWINGGKIALKDYVSQKTMPNPGYLVYRESILERIRLFRAQNSSGKVILLSASPHIWIQAISNHLGVFDICQGSEDINLKGFQKVAWVQSRFPHAEYIAAGDSMSDVPLLSKAQKALALNPSWIMRYRLNRMNLFPPVEFLYDQRPLWVAIFKQIRLHQWVKNVLLFVPMVLAHDFLSPEKWQNCILGFLTFCFAASTVYVFNDLLDLESDRKHHSKRNRPLAKGDLSILTATALMTVMACLTVAFCLTMPLLFQKLVIVYFLANFVYSQFVKRLLILDVSFLSGMYSLRIVAGGAATTVGISPWLLAFSIFFFSGLALAKRSIELGHSSLKSTADGRGYTKEDYPVVMALGIGTSLLSIVILCLYLTSDAVVALYQHGQYLWALAPILIYWLSRLWILIGRRALSDDPVLFALKDSASWFSLGVLFLTLWAAL